MKHFAVKSADSWAQLETLEKYCERWVEREIDGRSQILLSITEQSLETAHNDPELEFKYDPEGNIVRAGVFLVPISDDDLPDET